MKYPKEQRVEAFRKLSDKLKEVVVSLETAATLDALGREYALSPEDQIILGEEVALVLLGLETKQMFAQKLTQSLKKDPEQIITLADKISSSLFVSAQSEISKPSEFNTATQESVAQDTDKKPEYLVRGGWKPEHVPDIKSVERPISSSLIRKQVEQKRLAESEVDAHEKEHPETEKPKPYWPDPYRESLGDE